MDVDIESLKHASDDATPGPWEVDELQSPDGEISYVVRDVYGEEISLRKNGEDAYFAADMRNAIENGLLDEFDSMCDRISELESRISYIKAYLESYTARRWRYYPPKAIKRSWLPRMNRDRDENYNKTIMFVLPGLGGISYRFGKHSFDHVLKNIS